MAQPKAKCTNRVNCDAALKNELIEIPQDGKCPECGQPLLAEGIDANSATEIARSKRTRLMAIIGGISCLCLAGIVIWVMQQKNPTTAESAEMDLASMEVSNANQANQAPITSASSPIPTVTPKSAAKIPVADPVSASPSLETQQHINQGMTFVSLAKQNPKTRSENIKNALVEFDAAVKQEDAQGHCFASAYMNRGIAYWQDNKINLAEKDLLRASECDVKDPIVFYNLASYYSAVNKTDLALEPLDKALSLGFNDCDILRKDPDLKNLRNQEDFRRTLEKHQLFCLR